MTSNFPPSPELNETLPPAPLKIPRAQSLLHRLQHAKDPQGQPIALLDELLFFLDDPPPDIGDRWQKAADLCATHGITTSRMSVWRFYRAHILQWRRQQNPPPPGPPPTPEQLALLRDQAHHLLVQRALEILHDPRLAPGHLIGLLESDNRRQQIQLARDQFNDRLLVRKRLELREHRERVERRIREEHQIPAQMESYRNFFNTLLGIPPGNGTSQASPTAGTEQKKDEVDAHISQKDHDIPNRQETSGLEESRWKRRWRGPCSFN